MKAASSYALWEISRNQEGRRATQPVDSPPSYEETVRRDSEASQLMISYQWDSKDKVLVIKDSLTRAGVKVWLDEEQMSMYDLLLAITSQLRLL